MIALIEVVDDKLLNKDPKCSIHASGGTTFTINHKIIDGLSGARVLRGAGLPWLRSRRNCTSNRNGSLLTPACLAGRMYTIVSNIGDSPAVRIDMSGPAPSIIEVSQDQNCDDVEAVQRYCEICYEKGHEPCKVILGRFNYASPLGKRCAWMGDWGDWVQVSGLVCAFSGGPRTRSGQCSADHVSGTPPDRVTFCPPAVHIQSKRGDGRVDNLR